MATALDTLYDFTFTADRRVEVGEKLQIRVNDDEDAACQAQIEIYYYELDSE